MWIEIPLCTTSKQLLFRHFPCGSVDWNFLLMQTYLNSVGHFPCGSVDWNICFPQRNKCTYRHFPCGSVDWNSICWLNKCFPCRHFPCGSVDWNSTHKSSCSIPFTVTSLAEVWIEIHCTLLGLSPNHRHFPCGSVDWNTAPIVNIPKLIGHFPCGSVDWNFIVFNWYITSTVTSLAEVWIEIMLHGNSFRYHTQSLPLRKCGLKCHTHLRESDC